jgi:C4-dicarboxylate-specific signal transduction histidine kinase
MYIKDAEFRAWLVEERMINPETISKDNLKKEFARFAEDYNTATLPNEKYYDMARYEARMSALRAGEYVPQGDADTYDPMSDVRALETERRRKAKGDVDRESYLSKEQLQELRKVQQERVQAGKMKILGMDIKQNMGVRMDGTMFDG